MLKLILLFLLNSSLVWSTEFPLRSDFRDLKFISTKELHEDYEKSLIIDVRSNFEYDVVHIKKAINIPVANRSFLVTLKRALLTNSNQKMIFYCNGTTCKKSYKATHLVQESGYSNAYVYDAGIFNWIQNYPDKSVLLKSSPVDASMIIDKGLLQTKMLSIKEFKDKLKLENTVLIDIRDPFQVHKKINFNKKARKIPLRRMSKLLQKERLSKQKTLLIFDAVGKQVRWLQYLLEENSYKDYYFLRGGSKVLTEQE